MSISRKTNLFLGRVNTFWQLTGQFVDQLIGLEELVHFLAVAAFLLLWCHNGVSGRSSWFLKCLKHLTYIQV